MRRSEVLGLKWDAIDFKQKTISVYHTAVNTSHGMIYADNTKTSSSCRTIPLTDKISVMLKNLKKEQAKYKFLFGNFYTDNDHILNGMTVDYLKRIIYQGNLKQYLKLIIYQ